MKACEEGLTKMADSDKDILITPNISQTAQPEIKFVGKDNSPLYIKVLDDNSLSFEGVEGQIFSISPTMSSGDIFSVSDISGVQSMSINADGTISMNAQTKSVTIANNAGSPGHLTLATNELTVVDGDKLGRIDFKAPIEASGTDAILAGASIWAEADDTFAADNNKTELVFATAASEAAAEKMRLDSTGNLGVGTSTPSFTSGIGVEVSHATQANFRATDSNGASTDFATSGNDTYILNRHASGKIYIKPGNGDHSIELASNGQVKFNNAYTFPTSDGSNGQVLQTNGSGALSFASASGGASDIGALDDVLMDATNFVDSFLLQTDSDGSAPTTGTLSSATGNIGLGKDVLSTLTSGTYNIAIGYEAGASTTVSIGGIGIGKEANRYLTGNHNIGIGLNATRGATSGTVDGAQNIGIGPNSLKVLTEGNSNVSIGVTTGEALTTGDKNVLIGLQAGQSIVGGDENICIGSLAGDNITSGSDNVIIGGVDAPSATGSDQLVIASGDGGAVWIRGNSDGVVLGALTPLFYEKSGLDDTTVALRVPISLSGDANPGGYCMPYAGVVQAVTFIFAGDTITINGNTNTFMLRKDASDSGGQSFSFATNSSDFQQVVTNTYRIAVTSGVGLTFNAGQTIHLKRTASGTSLNNANAIVWVKFNSF